MRPPRSLIGSLVQAPLIRNPLQRRVAFAVIIALFSVLSFYPQRYRAALSLTPTDPASLGFSGAVGQLAAVSNIFGNQTVAEVSLKVARSQYVRSIVAERLNLPQRLGKSAVETDRWLTYWVEIRGLRGGIIQVEMKSTDAVLAKDIVSAFGEAIREQLAIISKSETAHKRQILVELVDQSADRLTRAQQAYDDFRLKTKYANPTSAIALVGGRVPSLQNAIQAKQVELNAAQKFGTDQNLRVQQIQAELAALRTQLAEARSSSDAAPQSVGSAVTESTTAERLRRELDTAQAAYYSFERALQGTSVEDISSSASVRILEPAYIDTERQINFLPMIAAIMSLLLSLACEFYLLRPPLSAVPKT